MSGGSCIYDYYSPCEDCGKCNQKSKPMYKEFVDDEHDEIYRSVSYDGGRTWEEE